MYKKQLKLSHKIDYFLHLKPKQIYMMVSIHCTRMWKDSSVNVSLIYIISEKKKKSHVKRTANNKLDIIYVFTTAITNIIVPSIN